MSRRLGRHLQRIDRDLPPARYWGLFLLHAGLDLAAAVALLWLLAWLIPATIDLYNAYSVWLDRPEPLPLRGYLCAAAAAPWTDGLWVMLMLVSTLIPTALHLAALVMSPVAHRLQPDRRLIAAALATHPQPLERHPDLAPIADEVAAARANLDAAIHRLARYLVIDRWAAWAVGGAAGVALVLLVLGGLWLAVGSPPALMLWLAYGDAAHVCPAPGLAV